MQTQEKQEEQEKPVDLITPSAEPSVEETAQAEQSDGVVDNAPRPAEPSLEERLAEAEARASEMQDAFLRAKAEAENLRRRAQEEIGRAHKFAIEGFAEALVPVKDSLEAALKVETSSVESYKQGVEMTLKQLSSAFAKNQLMEINPMPGERFDPMKHQAISMTPADQNANTIVNVLQSGYMIADRLLRPALVTVSVEKSS